MKTRKTIIFFPIEIGLAHIVRSLAIAEEFHSRRHKVIFALPKRKWSIIKKTPVQLVDVSSPLSSDSFESLNIFRDKNILKKQVYHELQLLEKYRPDAVIVDYRLSALASARINKTKTYFIAHGTGLPYGSYLPNPGLPRWLYKLSLPLLQKGIALAENIFLTPLLEIIEEYKIDTNLDDLFHNTSYILPEPNFYFPPLNKKLKLYYVGALEWKGFETSSPSWLNDIHPDGKTIYLSFGGTGFAPDNLINLSLKLVENNYRVIVSTGTICDPQDFPKHNNLYVSKFLPGKEVCQRVDTVICHGGYGTLIDAVYNNKPFVAIPFNPDQLTHAWRFEELGVGYCLLKLKLRDLAGLFTFRWKVFEETGKKINAEIVLKTLDKIETNRKQLEKNLFIFNAKHQYRNGAEEVANIIEKEI